jgi:hypothetical protein
VVVVGKSRARKIAPKKRKSAPKNKPTSSRKSTATARKEQRQAKFLELFPQLWTITAAAKAVGVTRRAVQKWLDEDPEFNRTFYKEAIPAVADALEQDAINKVIHGIPRPAGFYQGQPVMAPVYDPKTGKPKKDKGELVMAPVMIREFPTALHNLLLKGWRPERYKDKVEHSGPGGKPQPAGGGVLVFPIGRSTDEFIEGCRRVVGASEEEEA